MHDDEDENGGGNTSSQPEVDNIGVANEDDGNDVDVVKQWGIRHGEYAAVAISQMLQQIRAMRQRREEVMVAQQGLAASSNTGSCFLRLGLHVGDVMHTIARDHLRDGPWSTIQFASCCKALWSVRGLPVYLDFVPPQRTLEFWYLLCEPHFVLHNLEMQLDWTSPLGMGCYWDEHLTVRNEYRMSEAHGRIEQGIQQMVTTEAGAGAAWTVEEEEAARVKAAQEEAARLKAAEEVAARLKARVKAAEEEAAACGRQPPSFVFTLPVMLQQLASVESEKCLICCKRIPRAERVYSGCCIGRIDRHWACIECFSNWRTECLVEFLAPSVFCKSLQRLDITDCHLLTNCEVLAEANSVHTMRLIRCDFLVDLGGLGMGCQNLTSLHLSECNQLADLTGLSKCPVLSKIYLIHCRSVVDITPLAQCKVLHYLDLISCGKLQSVTSLGTGCVSESLQALVLQRCPALTDITGLDKCRSLQELTISGCTGIKDVSLLLKCEALSKLVAGIESHDWKGMDQLKSSTKYSVGSLKIDWMLRNRNGSVRGTY
jgi:hypothetical protein